MDPSDDLLNVHFESNKDRQGLTLSDPGGEEDFDVKEVSTSSVDKSRKGSIDHRILSLVINLNNSSDFFTTSSCSGRAIIFTHDTSSTTSSKLKKGCKWLYTTHDEIEEKAFLDVLRDSTPGTQVTFKVEPAILHVQCRALSHAKRLVHIATESGFRNSGMVIGKDNKMTVAIRSALGMEVPLEVPTTSEKAMAMEEYFKYLAVKGNEKLEENWVRTDKLGMEFMKVYGEASGSCN